MHVLAVSLSKQLCHTSLLLIPLTHTTSHAESTGLLQVLVLAGDAVATALADHTDLAGSKEAAAVHTQTLLATTTFVADLALRLPRQVLLFHVRSDYLPSHLHE